MIRGWLIDTNVISELRRPRPAPQVVAFVSAQALETLFTSGVVLAELRFGIEMVADAVKRAELQHWLEHQVRPLFGPRVLPVSEDVMLTWRLLVEQGRKSGHTFSQPDLIIAATALRHGLSVLTRNTVDYAKAGVAVVDPWQAA